MLVCLVIGSIILSKFNNRPHVEVFNFNTTPYSVSEGSRKILPQDKLHRTYVYQFRLRENFDFERYLNDYPDDAVLSTFLADEGYKITIYSNNLPDPRYFIIDGKIKVVTPGRF